MAAKHTAVGRRQAELRRALDDQLAASGAPPHTGPDTPAVILAACAHAVRAAAAAGQTPERAAVRAVVRGTLAELAERAPGAALEVRVPPFGAVQCMAGPRHTRGTPPGVVETDPTTWVELCTGTLHWADAVATHRVSASGVRADLGPLLPLC